jgi:putative protein-disulfide isomerase
MCSWCWGFAPTISKIKEHYNDTAPLNLVMGGLHAYDDFPMSDEYKAEIRHHWEDVTRATGADFDYAFFGWEGFVLDTEPACRAVVSARNLEVTDLLSFYESVSRSFYSENKDTTSIETFRILAEEAKLDVDKFVQAFDSDKIKQETVNDFRIAKSLGVSGFPTVLVTEDQKYTLLTAGYQPFESLQPLIETWLEHSF